MSWPELAKYCVPGRMSMGPIAAAGKDMAARVQRGLLREVLTWDIEEEEPITHLVLLAALYSSNSAVRAAHEMGHSSGLAETIMHVGAGLLYRSNWRAVRGRLLQLGRRCLRGCC